MTKSFSKLCAFCLWCISLSSDVFIRRMKEAVWGTGVWGRAVWGTGVWGRAVWGTGVWGRAV